MGKYERVIGVSPEFAEFLYRHAKKLENERHGEKVGSIRASRDLLERINRHNLLASDVEDKKKNEKINRFLRI